MALARGQRRMGDPRPACNDQPIRYSGESDAAGVGTSYVRAIPLRNAKISLPDYAAVGEC